jgi:hypothetical protein
LFGGEDVEVVASAQHMSSSSNTNSFAQYHHPATIDLYVRLASVTIKSHASFDVYPKSMVGDCEPLIQIHATTTEAIALQEIRTTDDASAQLRQTESIAAANDVAHTTQEQKSDRILQERITEKTGYRYLSIRPALYEKVSVWHTPS